MAKVLVVDDEPEIREFVRKVLAAREHEVVTASDGSSAIDIAFSEKPDVIVLDLNMPELDGYAVCRKLKGDPQTKKIPIIMMTAAYVAVEDAQRGASDGADEYIVKPFLKQILIHNVERLAASSQSAT